MTLKTSVVTVVLSVGLDGTILKDSMRFYLVMRYAYQKDDPIAMMLQYKWWCHSKIHCHDGFNHKVSLGKE